MQLVMKLKHLCAKNETKVSNQSSNLICMIKYESVTQHNSVVY